MNQGAMTIPQVARSRGFVRLMKLRLNSLVVFAVGVGAVVADPTAITLELMLFLLPGVLLAAGGTSALNQAVEWRRDALMERTRNRPIPSGLITPREGFLFGIILSVAGLALLVFGVNIESALLTAGTVVAYVALYTPLKPVSTWNTVVGALPGALPPLVGWAATCPGPLPAEALCLFAIIFFWQFPHFFAIASLHVEDYRRGGFAMLPVEDPTGLRTAHRVVSTALILVPVGLFPVFLGMAGPLYLVGALALGLLYLGASLQAAWRRDRIGWRRLLFASFIHLPGVFLLLLVERSFG